MSGPGAAADGPGELQGLVDLAIAFALFMMLPVAAMRMFAPTTDLQERVANGSLILTCGILPLLGFAWWRRAVLPVRLRVGRSLAVYGVFLVAWVPLAMILYPYLLRMAGYDFPAQETVRYYAEAPLGGRYWLVLAVTCIGAPVAEEIFFRGFLFRAVQDAAGPVAALLATSVLFGMVHEASVAIPVGVLGLCFGYLRLRSGGVGSSILVHCLHNTWTVALVSASPELVDLVYDK